MTWRTHPLVLGALYTVSAPIRTHAGSFVPRQRYRLVSVQYSPYDSSTVFNFKEEEAELSVGWWWHDDESDSLPSECFFPII
jgi:hypothetical protein